MAFSAIGATAVPLTGDIFEAAVSMLTMKTPPVCVSLLTFIPDRLYLAAYTSPPGPETYFPVAEKNSRRSPSKRSARAAQDEGASITNPPCYFSVDDTLLYNAFHHDFGPLHIGHLYRFAVQFHDILGAPENKGRPVVFWSKADPRSEFFPTTHIPLFGRRS